MVQFTLPRNSKMMTGKTWPKPEGATNTPKFQIYRWNPDGGQNPQVDTNFFDMDACGPMDLDALTTDEQGGIALKKIAPTARTF
jgi:succinate dehydrogenase iron-sulfur subunit